MALITDYATLQTEIASWLNRSDLTTSIPGFIQLAEAELKRRLRRHSGRDTLTISARVNDMPCAGVELRSIHLVTGSAHLDVPLKVVTPEILAERAAARANAVGRPTYAAITSSGKELLVSPPPDQSYTAEVIYFKALQALSDTNTENDELRDAPDAYLFGALFHAAPFLIHDERVPLWKSRFDAAIDQMNDVRDREEHNASLQEVRLPMTF